MKLNNRTNAFSLIRGKGGVITSKSISLEKRSDRDVISDNLSFDYTSNEGSKKNIISEDIDKNSEIEDNNIFLKGDYFNTNRLHYNSHKYKQKLGDNNLKKTHRIASLNSEYSKRTLTDKELFDRSTLNRSMNINSNFATKVDNIVDINSGVNFGNQSTKSNNVEMSQFNHNSYTGNSQEVKIKKNIIDDLSKKNTVNEKIINNKKSRGKYTKKDKENINDDATKVVDKENYDSKSIEEISSKISDSAVEQKSKINSVPIEDLKVYHLIPAQSRILIAHPRNYSSLQYLVKVHKSKLFVLDVDISNASIVSKFGGVFMQGDMNKMSKLVDDSQFDMVIFDESLLFYNDPSNVLLQASRIADYCLVSIPNKSRLLDRLRFLFTGSFSNSGDRKEWYKNNFTHNCNIQEFIEMCISNKMIVERSCFYDKNLTLHNIYSILKLPSLFADKFFFIVRSCDNG